MEPLHIEQSSSTINVHNAMTSNIRRENIYLTTLENPSLYHDQLLFGYAHSSIHVCVIIHCAFKKSKFKFKSKILACSTSRKKYIVV